MNARKGLKRYGMRSYIVVGRENSYIIQRLRPWKFIVRNAKVENLYSDFMSIRFRRLKDARDWAEKQAGSP